MLKIKEQIKNNPASAEIQSLKFLVKVLVNKTAASAAQLAKCILLHAYLRENKQIVHSLFNKLA